MKDSRLVWVGLGILLLLAGVYWFAIEGNRLQSLDVEDTAFALTDTASVTRIHLTQIQEGEEQLWIDLRRVPNGSWTVNQVHNAFDPQVGHLLTTLHRLQVREPLQGQGIQSAEKILSLMHTRVEVYQAGELTKTYLLGTEAFQGRGSLMKLEGADQPYIVERPDLQGFINPYFSLDLDVWREKRLFTADTARIREIRVSYSEQPEQNLTLRRVPETGWTLQPRGLAPDSTALARYFRPFQGKVFAESFAERTYVGLKEQLEDQAPEIRLAVSYLDGSERVLWLFDRPELNPSVYFGWVEGDGELLTIQHYVIDRFLATNQDLQVDIPS